MIPAGVQGYGASMPVDFRKGATGSMALVQDWGSTHSATLYVFRSKRTDRIKVIWWDGSEVCLFAKTLEEIKFCWPKIAPTPVQLNHAQLLALISRAYGSVRQGKFRAQLIALKGPPKGQVHP